MRYLAIAYLATCALVAVLKYAGQILPGYDWWIIISAMLLLPNIAIWMVGLIVIVQTPLYKGIWKE